MHTFFLQVIRESNPWRTSAIQVSIQFDFLLGSGKEKMYYFYNRMHKHNSRARLNVSQYKCNRRAMCVHLLHNIRICFIPKTMFKKMHFYVQLRIMALYYLI